MESVEFVHMTGGDREYSYAQNSVGQRKLIDRAKPLREIAVKRLYKSMFPATPQGGKVVVGIAELGCSTGPNALRVVHELITAIDGIRRESGHHDLCPEFQVHLNDIPGNDFNTVFQAVPGLLHQLKTELGLGFGSCFINGVPGSFYGRLFPTNSLHFVHSSSALHYLSQVPKGIERSKGKSAESVGKAYVEQFERDFSVFLKCRGEELVSGGCMVYTLHCRRDELPPNNDCAFASTLLFLYKALDEMASEGLLEKGKLDTFNRHVYAPSWPEMKELIKKEGSFTINNCNTFEANNLSGTIDQQDNESRIRYITTSLRSGIESTLVNHFGEGLSIDEVFRRYEAINFKCLTEELASCKMITVTLEKN